MTPTLAGRLQTRIVLILTVGIAWTALVGPLLPRSGGGLGDLYRTLFEALWWFVLIGCTIWEPTYHAFQQLRWENDWPISFGLLTFANEAIVVWILLGSPDGAGVTFVLHAVSTWIVMWAVAVGPLRLVLVRWRFRGGRVNESAAW